jgi:hypothetical protein
MWLSLYGGPAKQSTSLIPDLRITLIGGTTGYFPLAIRMTGDALAVAQETVAVVVVVVVVVVAVAVAVAVMEAVMEAPATIHA